MQFVFFSAISNVSSINKLSIVHAMKFIDFIVLYIKMELGDSLPNIWKQKVQNLAEVWRKQWNISQKTCVNGFCFLHLTYESRIFVDQPNNFKSHWIEKVYFFLSVLESKISDSFIF